MNAADICVYPTLSVVTSLYALMLDDNKRNAPADQKIEPDGTLIEVIIGTGICLVAAGVRIRLEPGAPDWRSYEKIVWKAFRWGGAPIVAWQIWRAIDRYRRRGDALQHYYTESGHADDSKRPTTTMAPLRWPSTEAH